MISFEEPRPIIGDILITSRGRVSFYDRFGHKSVNDRSRFMERNVRVPPESRCMILATDPVWVWYHLVIVGDKVGWINGRDVVGIERVTTKQRKD